jgi:hypothetical protein
VARHAAATGGPVHPLVAAALAQRSPESGGAHRGGRPGTGGSVGWPGPAPTGGNPVGWPGTASVDGAAVPAAGDAGAADGDAAAAEEPAPAVRRGWRRVFRIAA